MLAKEYLQALQGVEVLSRVEEAELWRLYKEEGNQASRLRLIEAYQPLVFKLVTQLRPPERLAMDLIQEGTVGLIEAVEAFAPEKGVLFSTFASYRIRGRLYNFLRRSYRQEEMQVPSLPDLEERLETLPDERPLTEEVVADAELRRRVTAALARLPAREQAVMQALYLQERKPQAVAKDLEISTSYLYKLQKRAVRRLRGMLARLMGELRAT